MLGDYNDYDDESEAPRRVDDEDGHDSVGDIDESAKNVGGRQHGGGDSDNSDDHDGYAKYDQGADDDKNDDDHDHGAANSNAAVYGVRNVEHESVSSYETESDDDDE